MDAMKKTTALLIHVILLMVALLPYADVYPQPGTGHDKKQTLLSEKISVRPAASAGFHAAGTDQNTAFVIRPAIGLLFAESFFAGISVDLYCNERFLKDASYRPVRDEAPNWEINSGGLQLNYCLNPRKLASLSLGIYAGFGKAKRNFTWNSLSKQSPEWQLFDKQLCQTAYFFFCEPTAGLHLNLSQHIAVIADAGYRFNRFRKADGVPGIEKEKFNKFQGGITLRFSGLLSKKKN